MASGGCCWDIEPPTTPGSGGDGRGDGSLAANGDCHATAVSETPPTQQRLCRDIYIYLTTEKKKKRRENAGGPGPAGPAGRRSGVDGAAGRGGPRPVPFRSPPAQAVAAGSCTFALHVEGWGPATSTHGSGPAGSRQSSPSDSRGRTDVFIPGYRRFRLTGLNWALVLMTATEAWCHFSLEVPGGDGDTPSRGSGVQR